MSGTGGRCIRVVPMETGVEPAGCARADEWKRAVEGGVAAVSSAQYQRAEALLSSALGLAELAAGSEQEIAITLNNLGTVYGCLGRPAEARRAYLRALSLSGRRDYNPMLGAAVMTNLTSLHTAPRSRQVLIQPTP